MATQVSHNTPETINMTQSSTSSSIPCPTPSASSAPCESSSASCPTMPSVSISASVSSVAPASSVSSSLSSVPPQAETKKMKRKNVGSANEKRTTRFIGRFGSQEQVDRCRNYHAEMARCHTGLARLAAELWAQRQAKKNKTKEAVGPKKTNSRILFVKDYRSRNASTMPKDNKEATILCSAAWNNLSTIQKQPWKDMASKINEALRPVIESKDVRVEEPEDVEDEEVFEDEVEEEIVEKPKKNPRGRKPGTSSASAAKRRGPAARTRANKRTK